MSRNPGEISIMSALDTQAGGPAFGAAPKVAGFCHPKFKAVEQALIGSLNVGDDIGAAVAVFRFGECVVDLTGGTKIDGGPYPPDAMQLVFSVTKGVTAICLAMLIDEGKVELDAPVARYWPEFAVAGKESVTVRQMMSHQAGLPGFDRPMTFSGLADWNAAVDALARQKPVWKPGTAHGYHALTVGYLAGEVIRRVSGLSAGRFLATRLAEPLGLDLYIGLPEHLDARVMLQQDAKQTGELGQVSTAAQAREGSPAYLASCNPPLDTAEFNRPEAWRMELPAANGIASARALASAYSTMIDGSLRRIPATVVDAFRAEAVSGPDLVLVDQPTRFGAGGFFLSTLSNPMLGPGSFGHPGRGGSLAFAHPETGIAFAYFGNRAIHDPGPHGRLWRLMAAIQASIS
jgi:CubicO group peptidase (beta-lactamase class C family)